jgi:hypothetical protein
MPRVGLLVLTVIAIGASVFAYVFAYEPGLLPVGVYERTKQFVARGAHVEARDRQGRTP